MADSYNHLCNNEMVTHDNATYYRLGEVQGEGPTTKTVTQLSLFIELV